MSNVIVMFMFVPITWLMLTVTDDKRQDVIEATPKLYCQYGAGHGKRVYNYELLEDSELVTDENDVFSLTMCMKWSMYVGK